MRRYLYMTGLLLAAGLSSLWSGFGKATGASALNFYWGKEEGPVKKPAKVYLALCTVVPTASSTGATITEATGATGYARKEIPAANIEKAVEGEPSEIKTTAETIFNAITGGTATVIAWVLSDSSETGKGNVLEWGTATSTVISATATPPTLATGSPSATLK
jgi:hypothetical protein